MFGRVNPPGLVYTIDLSKIADRANPRTVEAPIGSGRTEDCYIDWGDGETGVISLNDPNFPSHIYAEGAGDIFTVVVRSATGKLPRIQFNTGQASTAEPTSNISYAVKSIDHFAGAITGANNGASQYIARNCYNLEYIDTRLLSSEKWTSFYYALANSVIRQPLKSFCFAYNTNNTDCQSIFRNTKVYGDFPRGLFRGLSLVTTFVSCFQDCVDITGVIPSDTFSGDVSVTSFFSAFLGCAGLTEIEEGLFDSNTSATNISGIFLNCRGLESIPSGLFDNNTALTNVNGAFANCSNIGGEPYKFWEQSYAATISNTADCYIGCPAALRAQVPTAYGGTMTVS